MTRKLDPPRLSQYIEGTLDQFPPGFNWPYTVLLRVAYMEYAKERENGPLEINMPGYGVLTLDGLRYSFDFVEAYAAKKGYATNMEGVWG